MSRGDTERRPERVGGWGRRLVWALLFASSAALLAASVYRAATYPFTGDESLSFAIFSWEPVWGESANNHMLNTWLMRVCSSLFGNSELSLRLPNLLAHALYLASVLALLRRFEHTALLLAGFAFFNLNPFMLDFFMVARGYGLALAFTAAGLALLARAYDAKRRGAGFGASLYLSAAAGSLAVLSNYAFLNFYLPLLLACVWFFVTDESLRRPARGRLAAAAGLLAACGLFLAFVVSDLLRLQRTGGLYAGGKEGFFTDTVRSLVRVSLYYVPYTYASEWAVSAFVVGLFAAMLLFGVAVCFRRGEVPLFVPLLLVLALAAALPVAQHNLVGTLFPVDRGALPYVPLYAAALLGAAHLLWQLPRRRWARAAALAAPLLLAALLVWHFRLSYTPHSLLLWWFHRHDRDAIELVERDRAVHFPGRTVRLANSWMMEPSLNFYRVTRGYEWLEPITREPPDGAQADYVYVFASDFKGYAEPAQTLLASYPDTKTILLRVNRHPAP